MSETKKEKSQDILDDLRGAEKAVKAQLLIKQLAVLKRLAREILEAKEKSVMILEEIGVSADDVKRIIDFVNSMPSVQLSESDKKDLRDKVKRDLNSARHQAEADVEKAMEKKINNLSMWPSAVNAFNTSGSIVGSATSLGSGNAATMYYYSTATDSINSVSLNSGGKSIDVAL